MLRFGQFAQRFYAAGIKRTALYDFHVANGGRMVPFAGWEMPVLYGDVGIKESHMQCREECTLFDVSHMGQLNITGADREDFLESISPGNIKDLKFGNTRLTQMTNDQGGILDDTMITRKDGHIYQVINAACVDADLEHMHKKLAEYGGDVTIELIDDRQLLALQGPKAVDILQPLVNYDLSDQYFMSSVTADVGDFKDCYIARCGYTGEDGFEISVKDEDAVAMAELFVSHEDCEPAGLAPRDTLRLESGLCLYGSDMSPTWTVIESNLRWTIGPRRRKEANFPGADIILEQWENGTDILRVGFQMAGKRVAREHYDIFDPANPDTLIGEVTSGTLAPCVDAPVGFCYVPIEFAETGTDILVDIRGKKLDATIVDVPFWPQGYYRKPKK